MFNVAVTKRDEFNYSIPSHHWLETKSIYVWDAMVIDWLKSNKWKIDGVKSIGFFSSVSKNVSSDSNQPTLTFESTHAIIINMDDDVVSKETSPTKDQVSYILETTQKSVSKNYKKNKEGLIYFDGNDVLVSDANSVYYVPLGSETFKVKKVSAVDLMDASFDVRSILSETVEFTYADKTYSTDNKQRAIVNHNLYLKKDGKLIELSLENDILKAAPFIGCELIKLNKHIVSSVGHSKPSEAPNNNTYFAPYEKLKVLLVPTDDKKTKDEYLSFFWNNIEKHHLFPREDWVAQSVAERAFFDVGVFEDNRVSALNKVVNKVNVQEKNPQSKQQYMACFPINDAELFSRYIIIRMKDSELSKHKSILGGLSRYSRTKGISVGFTKGRNEVSVSVNPEKCLNEYLANDIGFNCFIVDGVSLDTHSIRNQSASILFRHKFFTLLKDVFNNADIGYEAALVNDAGNIYGINLILCDFESPHLSDREKVMGYFKYIADETLKVMIPERTVLAYEILSGFRSAVFKKQFNDISLSLRSVILKDRIGCEINNVEVDSKDLGSFKL